MAHELILRVEQENEVVLNNIPFRVDGTIGFELINNFGRKLQQGDPGPDDHSIDSNISQTEWTGGIGTNLYRGDDSRSNSWFSTLWLQTRDVMSLHPATTTHTVAGEEDSLCYVHSKLGGELIATFGKEVRVWDEATLDFVDPGGSNTTTNTPTGRGITFGSATLAKKLYIPTTGIYEVWDGSAIAAGVATEEAVAFINWENKLVKLDDDGEVRTTADATTWSSKGFVPEDYTPRSMFIFYNRENKEVVHVATSGEVYALDFANSLLQRTDFEFPDHPYQSMGATRWRGDAYVSAGLGVHRNAQGFITAVGLDGREGLPEDYQDGYITSLFGGYNENYALLQGGDIDFVPVEETADVRVGPPDPMLHQTTDAFGMLAGFNGLGWHVKWTGNGPTTNVVVASHTGQQRLFWGTRGAIYSQPIPLGYYNPLYSQQTVPLERYGEHITPYFNWGFVDIPKILKTIELNTRQCDENNYIKVWLRTDETEEWGDGVTTGNPLAIITTDGQHALHVGFEEYGDELLHVGLQHEQFQVRYEFFGDESDVYATPVITWHNFIGRKWQRALDVFTFTIDATGPHKGRDSRTQWDEIRAAARKKGGVPLVVGDQLFMVDVTTDSGNVKPGMDFATFHNITAILMVEPPEDADDADE
jgi:hypothetical protein